MKKLNPNRIENKLYYNKEILKAMGEFFPDPFPKSVCRKRFPGIKVRKKERIEKAGPSPFVGNRPGTFRQKGREKSGSKTAAERIQHDGPPVGRD